MIIPEPIERRAEWGLLLIFAILSLGIVAGGAFYYRHYERQFRAAVEQELSAIADLKVDELAQYRKERLEDAVVFFNNTAFSGLVRRFFDHPEDADAQQQIQEWTDKLMATDQYDLVRLLDAQGVTRLSSPAGAPPMSSVVLQRLPEILRSGQVAFQDFHRNEHDQRVYLDILIPFLDGPDGRRPLGVFYLRIVPEKHLYPFIQRWPVPSETAETLLVRRDGSDVLFLNELKFQTNTALNLRISLDNTNVPAVKAVLGQEGIVEGRDYRGDPVLAALRAVPDSPWFLVARMDTAEVFAPMRARLWQVVVMIGVLLFGSGACVGLVWRRQRSRFYRVQYESAEALRASEVRYRRLFEAAQDGVLILDAGTGMVVDVNPFLIEKLGFSREAFLGKRIWELGFFKDVVASQANFAKLREKGYVRYENLPLETADGRRLEVEFVSNVYQVNHNEVIQCNIRDITDRKQTAVFGEMGREVLQILNEPGDMQDSIQRVIAVLKTRTGFDAVGLRLQDGDDFPYFAQQGFPKDFLLTENTLLEHAADGGVCRDKDGNVCLECTCGLVISGKTDPANPLFTPGGSCWTNDSFPLLDLPPDQDPRHHPRNQCIHQGYASVALVPIRNRDRIIGLIQLNDRRKGRFTLNAVELLEGIASHIGAALMRKQAEEALRRSETKFHTLYDSTSDAVMLLDEKGFFDCNQAALTMFGCATREEFCSKHPADFSPPIQPDGSDSRTLASQGIATALKKGKHQFEWVHQRADNGETFPTDVLLSAMELDGKPVLQAVVRDITRRKQAEEKLRQLSRAVEQSPASIVITNPAGDIEYVNPKFVQVTGYTLAEALGKNPRILKSGEKGPAAYRELWDTISAGKEWRGEFHNKKKNGELYWESASISSIRDLAGRVTHYVAVKEDITARKQTEAERDMLIHDLQDALANVKSLSGLLPICASCKKIRDDKGYWSQVESYIQTHSEATFTHGICPDCVKKWYPDLVKDSLGDSSKEIP